MKEYESETLKKVQALQLGILKDVISICEAHGLIWFAFAGTAIGAIRHKGFIPWDDDIDIGMPRNDYENLLRILNEEYSDKYIVANPEYFKNYGGMIGKIMIRGTKFVYEEYIGTDCQLVSAD